MLAHPLMEIWTKKYPPGFKRNREEEQQTKKADRTLIFSQPFKTLNLSITYLALFFLLNAVAPNNPAPDTNSRAIQSVILLLSPVSGTLVSPSPGSVGL